MKCDELKPITVTDECGSYRVYNKSDVDAAIAELKQKLQDQCISCPVKMQEDDVVAELKEKADKADKVIAEKDKEIRRLENLCRMYRIDCDNLAVREANAYKEIERDNKNLRHQKYKRCLDKANYWLAVSYNCIDDKHWQKAEKHHYKWMELAKKFKEGV